MDLRPQMRSEQLLKRAKQLAFRGKLIYQPFIFDDEFATGAGLSILNGADHVPFVYCPRDAEAYSSDEYRAKVLCKPGDVDAFMAANARVDRFYASIIDHIERALGPPQGMSLADVGCNSGYFPANFALRGATRAVGFDRIDYGDTFELLNDILGTKIEFKNRTYNGEVVAPAEDGRYDLVLSVAVLVHLSDPLHHLSYLGSLANKALFVFTPCHDTDDYTIKFHNVNRYYAGDDFPYCFDMNTMSRKLLRLSFERMGFDIVHELEVPEGVMPPHWNKAHLGLLGIRSQGKDIRNAMLRGV